MQVLTTQNQRNKISKEQKFEAGCAFLITTHPSPPGFPQNNEVNELVLQLL